MSGTNEERQTLDRGADERIVRAFVRIHTGNIEDAGTDADVYFQLNQAQTLLDKPDYNDFEQDDTDDYDIAINMTLEELRSANISLKTSGGGGSSGWYCDVLELYVQFSQTNKAYLYKRFADVGWLADDEPQGRYVVLQGGA